MNYVIEKIDSKDRTWYLTKNDVWSPAIDASKSFTLKEAEDKIAHLETVEDGRFTAVTRSERK